MSQVSPDGRIRALDGDPRRTLRPVLRTTTTSPISRTTVSCRSSIPPAASWPGSTAQPASSSRCPAPTTRASCKPTASGVPTASISCSRAPRPRALSGGQRNGAKANDPNETQIQYDLYRIPFNGGRGGTPEPIAGASRNGMSNTSRRSRPMASGSSSSRPERPADAPRQPALHRARGGRQGAPHAMPTRR